MPITTTKTASEALGMYPINGARAKAAASTMRPESKLEMGVLAPLLEFNWDRVSDPEAAMPERSPQAILAIPELSIS